MERELKDGNRCLCSVTRRTSDTAVVVLNALGDIFDPRTGEKIAGVKAEDGKGFGDTREMMYRLFTPTDLFTGERKLPNSNTTVGAVITNGEFSKAELTKIASMNKMCIFQMYKPSGDYGRWRFHLCGVCG